MDDKRKKEHSSELTVPTPLFSNFYQDQYKRTVLATTFVTVTNLLCLFIIIFLLLEKPIKVYIPAEEVPPMNPPSLSISNNSITPRIAMDKANFDDEELNEWVLKTVTQLFSYDLQDYPNELKHNLNYLLPEAQNEYIGLLNAIVPIKDYTTKDVIVTTLHAKGAPSIYDQGVANQRYYWILDFPIEMQFSGTVILPTQNLSLHITIVRTSMENDVDGIKIASIKATKGKKDFISAL